MRLRLLSSAALAAAAFSFVTAFAASAPAAEPPASPVRLLILPVVVHSATGEAAAHVSGGLSDMIAARLEQTGRVFVDRPEDASLATSQLADALREGRARGADFVIFGAFTQFGDGASLDIQCIPVRVASEAEAAAARRIFIQSGTVGDIIPRLDDIAGRLAAYVNAGHAESANPNPGPDAARPVVAEPQPAPPPPGDEALRSIGERLEALEKAVFGSGDTSAAAQFGPAPPES